MDTISSFLKVVEAYCATAKQAEATLSSRVFSDGKRIAAIRDGADVGARRLEKAMHWLSDNWPEKAEWPAGIPRPMHSLPEAAE